MTAAGRVVVKAVTVQQPWAWAIIYGGKDVENRTQLWKHRGPLAIHAGARWSDRGAQFSGLPHAAMTPYLTDRQRRRPLDPAEHPDRLAFGAVIGVVDLVDVHPAVQNGASVTPWADWCCHPWGEGHHVTGVGGRARHRDVVHLVLRDPRPLPEPIPCKGRLGLWTPPPDVLDALREVRPVLREEWL